MNADGSITMKSSNYHGDEKITTETLSPEEMKNVIGYYVPNAKEVAPEKQMTQEELDDLDTVDAIVN